MTLVVSNQRSVGIDSDQEAAENENDKINDKLCITLLGITSIPYLSDVQLIAREEISKISNRIKFYCCMTRI